MRTGIVLSEEIVAKIDWPKLADKLASTASDVAKAASGDWFAGMKGMASTIGALTTLSIDVPPAARGLELIVLCFAQAFDSVRANGLLTEPEARRLALAAIAALKEAAKIGRVMIPADFFEAPTRAKCYTVLRDSLVSARSSYRISPLEEEREVVARFDVAFRRAVWELWASRHTSFVDLAAILSSPAALATDHDLQWQAYRASLIAEFNVRPLFGQAETSVSIGQLYIPLRCKWYDKNVADKPADLEQTTRKRVCHVCDLETELMSWINSSDSKDWLRLLGGGPGSGKSTSAKAFASKLAERTDLRPLYVPLQRISFSNGLRDSINQYFRSRSGSPFTSDPLDRRHVEGGAPLVLIFDGLDEISRPGENAAEIARDAIDWISDLYLQLSGDHAAPHKVLVTGRMPSFQTARRRSNSKRNEALEVVGLARQEDDQFEKLEGEHSLLTRDQREDWWSQYSRALGRPTSLPIGMKQPGLQSLTTEPLLCYLLALSGYLESDTDLAAENRNRVYQQLLHDVWSRGWGDGRAGKGKELSKEDFDLLFETMALAAWHGGDERVATMERFDQALKVTGAEEIYREFASREGTDMSNLAVNFYLKNAEIGAKGFEFTHKSFGEYLTAHALIRAADEVAELSRRRPEAAMNEWLRAVLSGRLSRELLAFLKDEARLLEVDHARVLKGHLEKLLSDVLHVGLPAHRLDCETWRRAEDRQRGAEAMLLAVVHSLSAALLASEGVDSARINIDWHRDKMGFGNLIHRLRQMRNSDIPELTLFSSWTLREQYVFSCDLVGINLSFSDLTGAKFFRCNLDRAMMREVVAQRTDFTGSRLRWATLENADMIGADLSECLLNHAVLEGANLDSVDLHDSELRDATLAGARLSSATLSFAELENTDFRGADLTGAKLVGLDMSGGKWAGAKFDGPGAPPAFNGGKKKKRRRKLGLGEGHA